MKMKFCFALAGAMLFVLASTANAGQPLVLSDHQMDGVTAGAAALSTATAQAIGELDAITVVQSGTSTNTATPFHSASATTMAQALAASVLTISLSKASVASTATLP
jgi:hypothetical protein